MNLFLLLFAFNMSFCSFGIDFENGAAFSGYNDVKIPGDTGTEFSLYDELKTDPGYFFRAKLFYKLNNKHKFWLFASPLRLKASGKINRDVFFEDRTFNANTDLEARYRFDSYRAGYQYTLLEKEKISLSLGITAKIRDASISLEGNNQKAEKTNTGFVPLINFDFKYKFAHPFTLLFEGDALAAKQGRAEDVFLGILYNRSEKFAIKAGYRMIEGGADVDEVYNFTLIHFASLGTIISF